MKLLLLPLLTTSFIFANNTFDKNIEYTCINTHNIQQGQTHQADKTEALKKPFIFTINENSIQTKEKIVFNYMMSRAGMTSYSNKDYMLLLTKNLEVGLVPKQARGQEQYYFKCNSK